MSSIEREIEAAEAEARETFDLGDFLNGRPRSEDTVTLFTDEVLGRKLGGEFPQYNQVGFVTGIERRGVLGEALDLLEKKRSGDKIDEDRLEQVTAEAEELTKRLEASALTVKLRSIPEDVKKQSKRKAKEALGIDAVTAENKEEFDRKEFAFNVARSIVSITNPDGKTRTRFSAVDAEVLRDKLPTGEFGKIHGKVMELSYKALIAEKVTIGDVDFSSAG